MEFMIEYDAQGRIMQWGTQQAGLRMHIAPRPGNTLAFFDLDEFVISITDQTHYHDMESGLVLARPLISQDITSSIVADAVDEITIPAPAGTVIRIYPDVLEVPEGDENFVFATDDPGIYRFEIIPPFPIREFSVEVTANEI